ncbi:hypothetical protein BKA65DRAFT_564503, partial [Rhexocercosporidium sp. MPI-PUGE-AT-0058]
MHSVYSNAPLNICGTAGNPKGLFIQRKNEHIHTGPIKIEWDVLRGGIYFCMIQSVWHLEVYSSRLNSRGWVLQERLLSQRNLHFEENQLYWECQQQTACELTPDEFYGGMHPASHTQKVLGSEHGEAMRDDTETGENNALSACATWNMIVETYCSSKLTFGTDKLVAISTLARHCQTHLGLEGEYLAGLWSSYLGYQLLWETHPYSHGKRQQGYRAPTWSWASIDGAVYESCRIAYGDERDIMIQVKGWKIDLASKDRYGVVSAGYI